MVEVHAALFCEVNGGLAICAKICTPQKGGVDCVDRRYALEDPAQLLSSAHGRGAPVSGGGTDARITDRFVCGVHFIQNTASAQCAFWGVPVIDLTCSQGGVCFTMIYPSMMIINNLQTIKYTHT